MYRQYVNSSDIRSVGYENNTLEIEFNRGGIYQYYGVPQERYYGLISANSCGSYFHSFIKPFYSCTKLN